MNQPQLNPRDGQSIPKREMLSNDQKRIMAQVAELTKSENHAISVLVQAQEATLNAVEDCNDRLQSIVDMFVKTLQHFQVPLPKGLESAITSGEYNPDEITPTEDEDEDDEEEDELAKP